MLWGGRLWRHADFLKLWGGQTISELGSQVTVLALPTVAVLLLHAGTLEIGILTALQRLPFPILGLFVGVWVDRVPRRRLLIAADVLRLLAVASVPAAAVLSVLTLLQLYVVALLMGLGTLVFDIAYLAFLPSLVTTADLVEGNTKLEATFSVARLLGPAAAGLLTQAIGAAKAIGADALSFIVSVVTLVWIRAPESHPSESGTEVQGVLAGIGEGLRLVFGHPVLRSLLLMVSLLVLGAHLFDPLFFVWAYNDLHLSPAVVGLVLLIEGLGGLAGVLIASRAAQSLGLGNALVACLATSSITFLLLPLATRLPAAPTLAILLFGVGVADGVFNINQVSLRQGLTENRLQGRMNATFRTVFWGAWPLSNVIGGILGARLGIVPTVLLAGAIMLLAAVLTAFTPLRRVERQPTAIA
jgi:MFS family permease